MFSSRVPPQLDPNRVSRAIRAARAHERPLLDLTLSNPTRAGLDYPPNLLQSLASPRGLVYDPQPLGLHEPRQAVAETFAQRGLNVAPDAVVLASSTSEAYSVLFKLLCEPHGSAVLVPVPSYPLFDHLTRLEGVTPLPYRLDYHGRWLLDTGSLDRGWTPDVRAALAVSPNNPTGSVLSDVEIGELAHRCATRDAALILDEVFAEYWLESPAQPVVQSELPSLTFRLGGLSKSAGLPQVKLGWIAVQGPQALVREALVRLELICDTYLSVSTPVQIAARCLMDETAVIRDRIGARIRRNHQSLRTAVRGYPSVELLHAEAGWSAILRVPSIHGEEHLAIELIERDGVVVHPGYFFDMPHEAFLVVSLLPEPGVFDDGVGRLLERARA
jgi:aspartate/methionine/tyrosine aminotransferase